MPHFLRFVLGSLLFVGSSSVAALPPEPGSTYDGNEMTKLFIGISWYPIGGGETSAQAEKRKRYQEESTVKAMQILRSSCAKNDADACASIADSHTFFGRFPDPRAARQDHAVKAADLYIQFCEAKPDELAACKSPKDFLDGIAKDDKGRPEFATNGLPMQWLRLARASGKACSLPGFMETNGELSEEQFDAALDAREASGVGFAEENCEQGIEMLDRLAASEARSLRELLCNRNLEDACRALGRLSQTQSSEEAALGKTCNAGNGQDCAALASKWIYRKDVKGFGAEARKWAQKACAVGSSQGCFMSGYTLVQAEFGAPEYNNALTFFAKACNMGPSPQREPACKAEKNIRDAVAAAKAKASAPTQ